MRFNSLVYVVFLALVVAVVWLLPKAARRWWLLGASYVFYASWQWPYLALMIGVTALVQQGARWISAVPDAAARKRRGALVIGVNLAVLALFKYLDWFTVNANFVAEALSLPPMPLPHWVLPLGISFYTFQGISYVVDVVRKRDRLHGFWEMQLAMAYFPQLIAGPIMRAKELVPQFAEAKWKLTPRDIHEGTWLFVSGLFVKVALADTIGARVDDAFARSASTIGFLDAWVMAVAFGLQVYFDFSSYSRMALGSARLMGIQLVENFDYPYVATSPVDFWNRWHMSLSRWIRDYLFYPLVGRSTSLGALVRAALLSMTLCGLWHGAGWTFVAWGLYHGVLIAGYHAVSQRKRAPIAPSASPAGASPKTPAVSLADMVRRVAAVGVTFALVSLGWIFFRAQDMSQALTLFGRALTPIGHAYRALPGTMYLHTALFTLAVWSAPALSRLAERRFPVGDVDGPAPAQALLRGVAIGGLTAIVLVYLTGQTTFVYFQF